MATLPLCETSSVCGNLIARIRFNKAQARANPVRLRRVSLFPPLKIFNGYWLFKAFYLRFGLIFACNATIFML